MANNMPPIPRDHDEASFSEIVPMGSGKISLFKSPLFIFGIATAISTVLLFGLMQALLNAPTPAARYGVFRSLTMVITAYMLMMSLFAVFLYSRTDRKIWYYVFPIIVICILLTPPFLKLFIFIFREMLPGNSNLTKSPIFFNAFIGMFFGAGLMEELMKAIPVLAGAAVTMFAFRMRSGLPAPIFDLLRVRGPLDGILMGVAAGAGFIFIETWDQYVPNIVNQVFKATKGNDLGAFGLGLMLLFPRVINGLAGHMAYAGIFGYFIGLAVIRPKKAPLLLLIGWLTAAILHALWNSTGTISEYINYLVAAGTVVVLIACLLKARQIEASIFGRSAETSGSIIVGASGPSYGMAPPVPPPQAPPQWGGGAPQARQQWGNPAPQPQQQWGNPAPQGPQAQWGAPAAGYPGGGPMAAPAAFPGGHPPPQHQPYPYPASGPEAATTPIQQTAPVGAAAMALAVAGVNVPLRAGAIIDLSTIPALGERGRGLVGEVSVHPRNPGVIGLKNLGTATWYARLRDGSVQPVEPQRNVRLAAGITIDFGGGIQGAIVG